MRYAAVALLVPLLGLSLPAAAEESIGNPGTAQESTTTPRPIKNLERKCGDTKALDQELRGTWHESPIFTSADDAGVTTQLYISDNGRTWTMILRFNTSDRSCILNYGEHAKLGDDALTN